MFKIYLEVYQKNIKLFLIPAVLPSILLIIILLIVFDVRNSDAVFTARVCQQFFALSGIFMLTPVFMPEQKDNTNEVILSKAMPVKSVYLIRLTEALTALIILTAIFVWILSFIGGDIIFGQYFTHTLATALILGSIGFMATRFSGNIGAGYIIALGFYMSQMFLPVDRIEIAKNIYIFTLLSEQSNIIPIYICAIIFIIVPLVAVKK